jgi:hypothetical protein
MPLVFDERNLLPEGVHDATLEDVVSAFGGTSRRDTLCENLRQYLAGVKLTDWTCDVLIDGSFVMPKVNEPNDIDLILVLPADWDTGRRDFRPFEYNVLDKGHTKRVYRIEVQPVLVGSVQHLEFLDLFSKIRLEWCEVFGLPDGARKGLVRVLL